jgi:very-short-patch-repair endonuclease
MRFNPTPSEALLWAAIRGKRLGVQFRRRVVIGPYIVDFCAPSIRLMVEGDGGYHTRRKHLDARRDRYLTHLGYRVVRLDARLVERSLSSALSLLWQDVAKEDPGVLSNI